MNDNPTNSAAAIIADATRWQNRASDPHCDAWVGASAGTGKTKLLTDRVLRLLLAGVAPGRILCLTYTRAAAAQMLERLTAQLRRWAVAAPADMDRLLQNLLQAPPDEAHHRRARQLFAQVIETPGGMKIMTLHAFCQSVLRRFPLEAGLSPHFDTLDEAETVVLLRHARNQVILQADYAPESPLARAMRHLASRMAEDPYKSLLTALSQDRHKLYQHLELHGDMEGVLHQLRQVLALTPQEIEQEEADILRHELGAGLPDPDALKEAARILHEKGSKRYQERGQILLHILSLPDAARAAYYEAWRKCFLKNDGEILKHLTSKDALAAEPAMTAEAERLQALEDKLKCRITYLMSRDILCVGKAVADAYEALKKERGLLDYSDQIELMRRLLQKESMPGWVMFKLDRGIDHLLVDEAQDTSPEQWEILQLLTAEFHAGAGQSQTESLGLPARSIFAVGDQKQSIYSFQGAEPAQFDDARDYFRRQGAQIRQPWQNVTLDVSFRSSPPVLALVDAVFADAHARKGLSFAAQEAIHHRSSRLGVAGHVELWPCLFPESQEEPEGWQPIRNPAPTQSAPMARVAELIATQIANWLDQGEKLASTGAPIQPGDILILLRQRKPFMEAMVRALKTRNIPVSGVDRMNLTEQLAVQDLLVACHFALLPEDDLSLATVLKSPLIGMEEEALFTLCHGRKGSLWQRLQQAEAFSAITDYCAELIARATEDSPYRFLSALLNRPCPVGSGEMSGRQAMRARLGLEAMDPLDELLNQALAYERLHLPDLQGFLHWLSQSEIEIKRELEQAHGAVRIMTIHGAKGLQAPIVFLPDSVKKPQKSRNRSFLWPEDYDDPFFWCGNQAERPEAVQARVAEAEAADEEEYHRLLYVALTRAEERLYVMGWAVGNQKAPAEDCWYDLIARGFARLDQAEPLGEDLLRLSPHYGWTAREEDIISGWRFAEAQTAPISPQIWPDLLHRPEMEADSPRWMRQPAPTEPIPTRPLTPSRPEHPDPAALSPLVAEGRGGLQRGSLLHDLLQILPDLPPQGRAQAGGRMLAEAAPDLPQGERQALLEEVMAVLDHPDHARIFAPDSRAEVPITGRLEARAILGRIDRLVITEEDIILLDYKSDRRPPKESTDIPAAYRAQMRSYATILQQIYPNKPIRPLLLYTLEPKLLEVDLS